MHSPGPDRMEVNTLKYTTMIKYNLGGIATKVFEATDINELNRKISNNNAVLLKVLLKVKEIK